MRKSFMLPIAAIATVATVALGQMAPTKTGDSAKAKVLTNDKGMTLYIFAKDSSGKSACNGPCTGNWPLSQLFAVAILCSFAAGLMGVAYNLHWLG
jgi:predicted lipoprotein with Yx(FWY)xxD motif